MKRNFLLKNNTVHFSLFPLQCRRQGQRVSQRHHQGSRLPWNALKNNMYCSSIRSCKLPFSSIGQVPSLALDTLASSKAARAAASTPTRPASAWGAAAWLGRGCTTARLEIKWPAPRWRGTRGCNSPVGCEGIAAMIGNAQYPSYLQKPGRSRRKRGQKIAI